MQRLQQKLSPWIALGVTCFSLSTSNYLNSLLAVSTRVDSVSDTSKSDTESTPQSLNSMEQSAYEQINEHRVSKGLSPLVLDGWLTQHAREHSQAMAKGEVGFDKQGLQQRQDIMSQSGPYRKICSLIAMNQGHPFPARTAVQSLLSDRLDSSLPNVEDEYELTGVGVAMNLKGEYYFTQIFLLR